MQIYNKYIVIMRYKKLAQCGNVNLPYGTECVVIDKHIICDKGIICYVASQDAFNYFSQNDDGNGLERGRLTQAIIKRLDRKEHDPTYQDKTPEKIKTKGRGRNGKQLICYVLYKPFKPYLDLWLADRQKRGIESEWLFTDVHDRTQPITISRMNSFARTYSKIMGTDVYLHSLRHFMTSELARANIPDSVIQSLIGWDSADMVNVYKDIDEQHEKDEDFLI